MSQNDNFIKALDALLSLRVEMERARVISADQRNIEALRAWGRAETLYEDAYDSFVETHRHRR